MKLDVGCGPNKKEGYYGIDKIKFPNVDIVCDVGKDKMPIADEVVEHIYTAHFIEHLDAEERINFMNEAYRVLKPGAKIEIIAPYWSSGRAYGDPTHKWPPITDFWFYYLDKKWRMSNAPHTDSEHWDKGYSCDFSASWGYNLHGELLTRNQEFQLFACTFYKESIQDIHATLTKK